VNRNAFFLTKNAFKKNDFFLNGFSTERNASLSDKKTRFLMGKNAFLAVLFYKLFFPWVSIKIVLVINKLESSHSSEDIFNA
jgi:hypothetical protein